MRNILTISKYEFRVLYRGWFFRIFSLLVLIICTINSLGMTGVFDNSGNGYWPMIAMSGAVPYFSITLLNMIEVVMTVFLASDFLKRDKKLDTTVVIYARPMSNGDYVLGKLLSIVSLFSLFNLLALTVIGAIVGFNPYLTLDVRDYLISFFIFGIPPLLFVTGLSFVVMSMLKNQALTFVVLLAYGAVSVFYLYDFHPILDFTAFWHANMPSEIVGFIEFDKMLWMRAPYLSAGISFVLFTVALIDRPWQSRPLRMFCLTTGILGLGFGGFSAWKVLEGEKETKRLAKEIGQLKEQYADAPELSMSQCDLKLSQKAGGTIDVDAGLKLKNISGEVADTLVMRLNPALNIDSLWAKKQNVTFTRKGHLLLIVPEKPLSPEQSIIVKIRYSGGLADYGNHKTQDIWDMAKMERGRVFLKDNYALLLPKVNWYPQPGAGYSEFGGFGKERNFTWFTLNVTPLSGLTPISQGEMTEKDGVYKFVHEDPLPVISLAIGDYEMKSVKTEDLEYRLAVFKGHDTFTHYFDSLDSKAVGEKFDEVREKFESSSDRIYPYARFNLVEVPIQLSDREPEAAMQPEMFYYREKGAAYYFANIRSRFYWTKNRNKSQSPKDRQLDVLNQVAHSLVRWNDWNGRETIFKNYYSFSNYLKSDEWSFMDMAMESYLKNGKKAGGSDRHRWWGGGLSKEDRVNMALQHKSMAQIMEDTAQHGLLRDLVAAKGGYLFGLVSYKMGEERFENYLDSVLDENLFRQFDLEELKATLVKEEGIDIEPYLQALLDAKQLPAFELRNYEVFRFKEDDATRFQLVLTIANKENATGLVTVELGGHRRGRGRGGRGGGNDEPISKAFEILGNRMVRIGIVSDEKFSNVSINALISQNLPAKRLVNLDGKPDKRNSWKAFEGLEELGPYKPLDKHGELIVDNEDEGFHVEADSVSRGVLKAWVDDRQVKLDDKYSGLRIWSLPNRWRAFVNNDCYGNIVRSAEYTRPGYGEKRAVWEQDIPEEGYYEVFAFCHSVKKWWRRNKPKKREKETQTYAVGHSEGSDDVEVDMPKHGSEWRSLGVFYFEKGKAKVTLTNRTTANYVVADAIKWIKSD
ncbi:golvesin C-terminal-like domain-containing protein [Fulvitalea axinellae]|uniref:golvesin C-terminal-like domain-containing protein n=1 Tax=Fulvitalea axinellae TaxID=1182444 RepID=UPI0030CA23F5